MDERRRQQRWPSLLGAKAIINGRLSTIDCLIRDVSASGAHVVLGSTALLPLSFRLHVPCRGKTWNVALKWRAANAAGLELESLSADNPEKAMEREIEVRRLRREITSLRRHIETQLSGL